jgi:hypothetical protein
LEPIGLWRQAAVSANEILECQLPFESIDVFASEAWRYSQTDLR